MSNRRSDEPELLFLILFVMAMVLTSPEIRQNEPSRVIIVAAPVEELQPPTIHEQMAEVGITCPHCPDVPSDIVRVRETALLEGPTTVTITSEYVAYIHGWCTSDTFTELGQRDCLQRLEQLELELELARVDVESWINPLYGRPPFSEGRLRYLARASEWTIRHLANLENHVFESKEARFRREIAT